jgi:hypothetical protein
MLSEDIESRNAYWTALIVSVKTLLGAGLRILQVLIYELPLGEGGLFALMIETVKDFFPCSTLLDPHYTDGGLGLSLFFST